MRVFAWSFFGFLLGFLAAYGLVLFGYTLYAEAIGFVDRDGGIIMGVAFGVAPLIGLMAGLIGAFWCGLRAARACEPLIEDAS